MTHSFSYQVCSEIADTADIEDKEPAAPTRAILPQPDMLGYGSASASGSGAVGRGDPEVVAFGIQFGMLPFDTGFVEVVVE